MSFASDPLEIRLWEGTAPGSEGADAVKETSEERGTPEKPDRKIQGVSVPTITIHRPSQHKNKGTALILIPGGGYSGVVIDKSGHDIALHVTATTPPAFLVSTYDDHVKAENSLLYFKALRAVEVPAELHIYEEGGHGYGINPTGKPVAGWHHRMAEWMKQRGLLTSD